MGVTYQLPLGIQQSNGVWTKEVELDEMDGECENVLLDQEEYKGALVKSGSRRISEILARCTLRVGDEKVRILEDGFPDPNHFLKTWENAFIQDRSFATVRLREFSKGKKFKFDEPCPYCDKEIQGITVNLDELEVTSISLEDASKPFHEVTLPSGATAGWRWLVGLDEPKLVDIVNRRKKELATATLYLRLVTFNGKLISSADADDAKREADVLNVLKRMKTRDLDYLRAAMSKFDAGIDQEIEVPCFIYENGPDGGRVNVGCGRVFKMRLPTNKPSFFFPSGTESSSSPSSSPSSKDGTSTPQSSDDGRSAFANAS